MANPQHLEWLREGVEAWNARREREDFIPDFELLDFNAAFSAANDAEGSLVNLAGYNLSGANLTKAKMVLGSVDLQDFQLG